MTSRTEALGDRLRRLRQAAGLSMRGLSDKSGVNFANISRLESGEATKPKPETLTRLAEALGADASELFSAAGYTTAKADALPNLPTYLRSKYSHLPADARKELAAFVTKLEAEHGAKPKPKPRPAANKKQSP